MDSDEQPCWRTRNAFAELSVYVAMLWTAVMPRVLHSEVVQVDVLPVEVTG